MNRRLAGLFAPRRAVAATAMPVFADRRGVVAVEFALVLPVLMLMFLGSYETYLYIRAVSICERTAFTIADLIARRGANMIDDASGDDSNNIGIYYAAAPQIAEPLALSDNGSLIISSVYNDGTGNGAQISWQRSAAFSKTAHKSTLGTEGGAAQLPTGLTVGDSDGLIAAEVFYTYKPFVMSAFYWADAPGDVTIYRRALYRPRYGTMNQLQSG